jgi:hypothetical protein
MLQVTVKRGWNERCSHSAWPHSQALSCVAASEAFSQYVLQ